MANSTNINAQSWLDQMMAQAKKNDQFKGNNYLMSQLDSWITNNALARQRNKANEVASVIQNGVDPSGNGKGLNTYDVTPNTDASVSAGNSGVALPNTISVGNGYTMQGVNAPVGNGNGETSSYGQVASSDPNGVSAGNSGVSGNYEFGTINTPYGKIQFDDIDPQTGAYRHCFDGKAGTGTATFTDTFGNIVGQKKWNIFGN